MVSALDRVRAAKKPAAQLIPICMDPALVAKVQRLATKKARLTSRVQTLKGSTPELDQELADVEEDLEAAEQAVTDASEWFEVRALKPDTYQALIDQHTPTKDQVREARKIHGVKAALEFNIETFPKALVAACTWVVTFDDPKDREHSGRSFEQLTPEFVGEMLGDDEDADESEAQWSNGEFMALYNACYAINQNAAQVGAAGND